MGSITLISPLQQQRQKQSKLRDRWQQGKRQARPRPGQTHNRPGQASQSNARPSGLNYWMGRALKEIKRASENMDAESVHDLRVVLRRCRSMAGAIREIDSDKSWRKMKKSSRKLFRALGDLRDTQVMMQWVEKLSHNGEENFAATSEIRPRKSPGKSAVAKTSHALKARSGENSGQDGDPLGTKLLDKLKSKEQDQKHRAQAALDNFDAKAWRRWAKELPQRARRIPRGGLVFQHLVLEKWQTVHQIQARALRSGSPRAVHKLRIALKHFRYSAENFLPRRSADWSAVLKELQDLLGDVHDFDVLRERLRDIAATVVHGGKQKNEGNASASEAPVGDSGASGDSREAALAPAVVTSGVPDWPSRWLKIWCARIEAERKERLSKYRAQMQGRSARLQEWRAGLPQGARLHAAAMARLAAWAGYRDPDIRHSERVAALALQLFDGVVKTGIKQFNGNGRARRILHGAALIHDAGRCARDAGHHKESYRLIRSLAPPLDWSDNDMHWMALVARYHRGAEPKESHQGFASLPLADQQEIAWLAALLRLADGFDTDHNGRVRCIEVHSGPEAIVVRAHGYVHDLASAEHVAQKKHLLESLCARPVVVRSDSMEAAAPALASVAS